MSSLSLISVAVTCATATVTFLGSALPLTAQQATCDAAQNLATLIETVTDRTTRVPLAGALVIATWRDQEQQVRVRTDSIGRTVICAPPQKQIAIKISYYDVNNTEHTSLTIERFTRHTSIIDVPGAYMRGIVLDQETGAVLANVAVRVNNTPLATFTDANGRFYFERVPIGDYTMRVEHLSYARNDARIMIRDDDLDATIRLTPEAIPMQPIVVVAFSKRLERAGFYERRKRGVGRFIDRRQVESMNVQSASDLLRSVPGMRLIPQGARRNNQPRNATVARGNCRFMFVVDGTRTLSDFEMDYVQAGAIEGVEIYNGLSEVPTIFRSVSTSVGNPGSGACGVIAIWTRDSR